MLIHDTKIRVRYGEVDQMGFLYHSHYVEYYDAARSKMLRDLGLPYTRVEKAGVMMPVLNLEIRYIKPARYDDLVTVRTILRNMPGARISFEYEVYRPLGNNGNGEDVMELINTAKITLAFMNSTTKRACRVPEMIVDIMKGHFANSPETVEVVPSPAL